MQPLMRWQSVVLVVVGGALAALLVALTLGGGEELALLGTGGVGARVASKSEATTPAPAVGRVTAMTRGARLVPGHSTRFSDTYQRRDGSLVTKVFSRPVNVRDGRGTWRPIDPRLVVRGAGFAARRAPLAVALPRRLGAGVQVGAGRDRMSMRLLGADGTAVVRGARARYSDVLPRVTAIYDSQGSRLREQLVLADRRAPARLRFALSASAGLRARQTRSGDVIFTRRGRAVFTLPASYAFAPSREASHHPVSSVLRRSAGGWTLTVAANQGWVHQALGRGPVVIDPTVVFDASSLDCRIESASFANTSYCSSNELEVGSETGSVDRSVVKFDLSSLPTDAAILSAGLDANCATSAHTQDLEVHRLTRAFTSSVTWNKYDGTNAWTSAGGDFDSSVAATTTASASCDQLHWYVTKLVAQWVNGAQTNYGVLLKATNETTGYDTVLQSEEGNSDLGPELDVVWAPRTGRLASYTFDSQSLTDRMSLGVNVANGNLLVSNQDVHVSGTGLDVDVTHFHNSLLGGDGLQGVGVGGTASVGKDVHLQVFGDGSVAYFRGDGVALPFLDRSVSGGTATFATAPPDLNATLKQDTSTGVYTLTFDRAQLRQIFNSDGQLTDVKDQNDNTISFDYYVSGGLGLQTVTDTQGRVFDVDQNGSDGDIAQITDPTARTWSYTYGSTGSDYLTDYQDAAGNDTLYGYDGSNRLNQITTPAGNVTKITYDGTSPRVASVMRTTNAGHTTGPTTSYAYSTGAPCVSGQKKTVVTDPNSHNITYCSDVVNDRVAKAIDADSRTRSTTYKVNGDIDTGTSAGGSTLPGFNTTYSYSTSNSPTQRVRTTGTGGSPTTLTDSATYNATGSGCSPAATWLHFAPDTTTDPQSNVTTYGRDCKGNLTSVRDTLTAQNQITFGSYDSKGNPGTVSDANGNTTTLHYDTSGRLDTITPPTTTAPSSSTPLGATAITYDSLSRVDTVTDGKSQETTLAYDDLDRVTQITYDDGSTVSQTYDDDGNVTERDQVAGGVTKVTGYTYDKLNHLTREDFPDTTYNTYGYDNVGNLTSLQDASGTTSYSQGNANLLSGETEPGASSSFSFGYDDNAFRTSTTFPNGVVQTLSHDGIGRVTHIVDKLNEAILKNLTYSYIKSAGGDSEQLRTLTDNVSGDVTTYSYDVLNRLTDAWTKNGSTTIRRYQYTLDGNGNITQRVVTNSGGTTTTTYAYNANNQLCWAYTGTSSNTCGTAPSGATSYTYDANGNQTGTGTPSTSSSYNAKDQTTSLLGTSMAYLGDGQNELITDGTATLHNSILDTTSRTVSSTTDYFTRDDQGLLLADRGSSKKYYLLDPLGSVIATTNSSGSVSASYAYDPYGASIGTAPSPFGYTSGYRTTSGLYHYGARYYNPADQRWTQLDSAGQAASLTNSDPYTYAGGDPANASDTGGLVPARDSGCGSQAYTHLSRHDDCPGYSYTPSRGKRTRYPCAGTVVATGGFQKYGNCSSSSGSGPEEGGYGGGFPDIYFPSGPRSIPVTGRIVRAPAYP